MKRMKLAPTVVAIVAVLAPSLVCAQNARRFDGWYIGGQAGVTLGGFNVRGYDAMIANTTNINVPGRGIIIVPGTSTTIPDTRTGDLPVFQTPQCVQGVLTGRPCSNDGGGDPVTGTPRRTTVLLVGGQVGYQKELASARLLGAPLAVGLEAGFSLATIKGTSGVFQLLPATALTHCAEANLAGQPCNPTVASFTRAASSHWTSSLTARAGWIWRDTWVYGVGGLAVASTAVTATDSFTAYLSNGLPCPPCTGTPNPGEPYLHQGSAVAATGLTSVGPIVGTGNSSHLQVGWTVGVGIEREVWNRVRLGIEYRHSAVSGTYPGTANAMSSVTPPIGQPFLAGGIATPDTRVSLVDDRIVARVSVAIMRRR